MAKRPKNELYWRDNFSVTDEDELAVQTYIEEQGEPLTLDAIAHFVVRHQIQEDADVGSGIYSPNETYEIGQKLKFPAFDNKSGEVLSVRPGNNPRIGDFDVIKVKFAGGAGDREFIAGSSTFRLTDPDNQGGALLSEEEVFTHFGDIVLEGVRAALEDSGEYITFDDRWLPKAMLIPIHEGHLNIAEAMIDMVGSTLATADLLPELELDVEGSALLKRYSLNYALSQDPRFTNTGSEREPKWDISQ